MTARGVLTFSGLIMIVQGVLFFVFSIPLTQQMFPTATDAGIQIGVILRELLAGGSIFIGIILYLSRKNTSSSAKRVLVGACFGFSLVVLIQLKLELTSQANIPIIPLLVFAGLALTSFIAATKSD